MNFYDIYQPPYPQGQIINNQLSNQDLNYRLLEIEKKIKKLELKIERLESSHNENSSNYNEPDTGLYMI